MIKIEVSVYRVATRAISATSKTQVIFILNFTKIHCDYLLIAPSEASSNTITVRCGILVSQDSSLSRECEGDG